MPKQVDHEQRRRQIAEAVWRLASDRGLEAVSMRHVAAAAGMSTPLLQRYFEEKDALLRFAMDALNADADRCAQARIRAAVPAEGDPGFARVLIRALFQEFLPLDEQRRTVLLVHMAFFSRSMADRTLASIYRDSSPALARLVTDQLTEARRRGHTTTQFDPAQEADTLLTVAIGLGIEVLIGVRTTESANALIDYHLDRIFGAHPGEDR